MDLSKTDDCIDPSVFRNPVRFLKPTPVYDTEGGHDTTWTQYYRCFAQITSKHATRAYRYMQLYPEMDELFTIRYVSSVTLDTKLRLAFRNREYEILGVFSPDERQLLIHVVAKMYRANGTPG